MRLCVQGGTQEGVAIANPLCRPFGRLLFRDPSPRFRTSTPAPTGHKVPTSQSECGKRQSACLVTIVAPTVQGQQPAEPHNVRLCTFSDSEFDFLFSVLATAVRLEVGAP